MHVSDLCHREYVGIKKVVLKHFLAIREGHYFPIIGLFHYTPLQMTINGVQGAIGNMSRGGWSFKCLSRGARRHNRSLSRGEGNNIEACPGGWNKTEACPGGIYKSVPGRWRYNISLSRGGGGGRFAIIVICRGVRLNNGIAQYSDRLKVPVGSHHRLGVGSEVGSEGRRVHLIPRY